MEGYWQLASVLGALLVSLTCGQDMQYQTCTTDNTAVIQKDADAFIGGIISLSNAGTGGYGCGSPAHSMQAYEAMRWVLDLLNKKDEYLQTELLTDYYVPGIKLGMKVTNYCNNEQLSVAALPEIFSEMHGSPDDCSIDGDKMTLGVIGPTRSDDAVVLSKEAEKYDIPLVSYEATAPDLTASSLYNNFMRTISPDGPLMDVIVDILIELKWEYIAVVYADSTYGRAANSELQERLATRDICLTASIMVDPEHADAADNALSQVLNTEVVGVIFFGPSDFAQALLAKGEQHLPESGRLQWLLTDFPVDTTFNPSHVYQRGILSVSAASRLITEFEDHWMRIDEATHSNTSDENPWFTSWFEHKHNCKFNPTNAETDCADIYGTTNPDEIQLKKRAEYQQDQYVEAAVMSVFTYANALRTAQIDKCGENNPGACFDLRTMTKTDFYENYLKKVDIKFSKTERVPTLASYQVEPYRAIKELRFDSRGDIVDPSFYIWNYNNIETGAGDPVYKFRRVGSYINGRLNLNNVGMYSADRLTRLLPLPASPCPATGCKPCIQLPADVNYYYEPGDIVINGIFSLHGMGSNALTCGESLSPNQYQFLQAMINTIDRMNTDYFGGGNVKLGGLGFDDCSSSTLGQSYLVQVQRGNLKITNQQGGEELDPQTIEAYTAAHDDALTLPLAQIMNELQKPMVGYRARGSELSDGDKYPYYLMAQPDIYKEMMAIVLLLKKWEWHYVQVVTSSTHFSMDAEKVFREVATQHGICIAATHTMGQDGTSVIRGLQAHEKVQPVVTLLEPMHSRALLMAFKSFPATVRSDFALIATSRWGTSRQVVDHYEDMAEGVLTLSFHRSTLASFEAHLRSLNASTYRNNPWFAEWYQEVHNCSLVGGVHDRPACDPEKDITTGPHYQLDHEVEGVINSVELISAGLRSLLRQHCGGVTMCPAFVNAAKGMDFVNLLKTTGFNIVDVSPTVAFTMDGRSAGISFELNNFKSGQYQKVGEIQPREDVMSVQDLGDAITLFADKDLDRVVSSCSSACLECLYMFQNFEQWHLPGDLLIGTVFDVHYRGTGPFTCGKIRTKNGALYTEVAQFALERINADQASVTLDNFKLGLLGYDGCSNPQRAAAIVNQVHTGATSLQDGQPYLTKDLLAWVAFHSETSVDLAGLLRALDMPLVSPAATTSVLDDKGEYPTTFRTVPSDTVLVKGMVNFVQEMGWRYVVTLNSPDEANRHSVKQFREALKDFGICVMASFEFETDGSYEIILQSITQMENQVVAVFSDPDRYVEGFVKANRAGKYDLGIKYIANRPWGKFTRDYENDLDGSVFFEVEMPPIADFVTYLDNLKSSSNPWFNEIYEEMKDCNLPGSFKESRSPCDLNQPLTSAQSWEQDIWTLTTLNAYYSLARAVNEVKVKRCTAAFIGICEDFYSTGLMQEIMNSLKTLSFTDIVSLFFEFIAQESNRGFQLRRYTPGAINGINDEGTVDREGKLTLDQRQMLLDLYKDVKSVCPGDCLVCTSTDATIQDLSFISGDVYIVGLFDIHKQGGSPFSCGPINPKHGLPLLEAFNYAINYVNDKRGIFANRLSGVFLGGVGLDMCQSPSQAANLVSNIHSGKVQLTKGGDTVRPDRIEAYIATMDTESSLRVADILSQIDIPQISYGATGMELLDRETYDFFLRSVPADDKQSRAIVSYLKKFKYNNIQVVYSFDEIGTPGLEEFEKVAFANKICVKEKALMGEGGEVTPMEARAFVDELAVGRERSSAEVIVVWMKNPLPLLEAVSANGAVSKDFLFIVTDKWGADPAYLTNHNLFGLLQHGNLVTLDVESADVPGFDQYLEGKSPDNYFDNPWFKDYFEEMQNCYWDVATGTRTTPCDKSVTLPRADDYVQDPYVLYVINSVFSAAMGIDIAMKEICGDIFGICNLYRISGERRQEVMKGLGKVNFIDDTFQPYFYTADGQSDRGFHIYNVTSQNNRYAYSNVGSYNDTHFLKLDIRYNTGFNATCDATGEDPDVEDCVCPFPADIPSRYMVDNSGGQGLTLVYVGDIHEPHAANNLACGNINTGVDLQKLLAFFYAIELVNINAEFTYPDSIKLNGLALDSCSHGLRLGQDMYNVLSGNRLCDTDEDTELVAPNSIVSVVVDKDKNSLPIGALLTDYKLPSISPTATHDDLGDPFLYPYFLRVKGDNAALANVIMEVAKEAGWNYVSAIYSDGLGQESSQHALLESSQSSGVCVSTSVPLALDADLEQAKMVLERVSTQVGAVGVVLFVEPAHLNLLLRASKDLGLAGRFVWVLAADWALQDANIAGLESELTGAIMIETRSAFLKEFNDYMKSLTFTNRKQIPDDWFLDIYENLHQCNVLRDDSNQRRFSRICTQEERITDDMISQDASVLHVIISVLSTALGLDQIPQCKGSKLDIAACLQNQGDRRGDLIYDGISSVNFEVLKTLLGDNSFAFSFDSNGDGRPGYYINNYRGTTAADKSSEDDNLPPYDSFRIGEFSDSVLNISSVEGSNLLASSSQCPLEVTCTCQLPRGRTWSLEGAQSLQVIEGQYYEGPESANRRIFVKGIPESTDRFDDVWAIIVSVLAAVGAFVALVVFIYLLVMYPVRGGTTILGYFLSFGIILLYLMVFPFVAHADTEICGLRRFGLGFVYAIVYASLLVKLVDCWRVRGKGEVYDVKYSKLGRPAGLFMVTLFLVLIQVMIAAEWLILEEPGMHRVFEDGYYWPKCTDNDDYDESLVLSLCYVMALIVVGLVLALVTFTSTQNHRESRWILAILILSVPCWVIWCLVSILAEYDVRDAAVAIGLLVNATVMLLLVPIRKLYLLHKYNVLIEEEEEALEEERSHMAASHRGGNDYNSVYGRQYDNKPRLQDSGSHMGSGY